MVASTRWTAKDIGDVSSKTIVITGGNSGIGYQSALYLAGAGAHVILACRNVQKGEAAQRAIVEKLPQARVDVRELDLASLASIGEFVEAYQSDKLPLDILINNAGVMMTPRQKTVDGFELQFGTNHLGHFALTLGLLPVLATSPAPRVVMVSSHMHVLGRIDLNNLQSEKWYDPTLAYGRSKLANLLFALELERRLREIDSPIQVISAHPGYCDTELQQRTRDRGNVIMGNAMVLSARLFAQNVEMGALPIVRAAVDPTLAGGEYIGPRSFAGSRGYPVLTWRSPAAKNEKVAKDLWDASEVLTQRYWRNFVG